MKALPLLLFCSCAATAVARLIHALILYTTFTSNATAMPHDLMHTRCLALRYSHLCSWLGGPWSTGPVDVGNSNVLQPSLEPTTTSSTARCIVWRTPSISLSTSVFESELTLGIADNGMLQYTRYGDAEVQWSSGITPTDAQDVRLLVQVSCTSLQREIEHSITVARYVHAATHCYCSSNLP
jgi:hypothetical protein